MAAETKSPQRKVGIATFVKLVALVLGLAVAAVAVAAWVADDQQDIPLDYEGFD